MSTNPTEDRSLVYKMREARSLTGLSRDTFYKLVRSGDLPTVQIGKRRYVPKDALHRLLGGAP